MDYNLTIARESPYLHVVVTGTNSKEAVAAYLKDVLHECTVRQCVRVLIEERLDGPRLTGYPVFEIASEGSKNARGKFDRIAYVDVNASGDLMQFAETVALNRGLPIAIFRTVADAVQWLQEGDSKEPGNTRDEQASVTTP